MQWYGIEVVAAPIPFSGATLIIGPSDFSRMKAPDKLHVLIIDGCHCYNHLLMDFYNYYDKLVTGGLLLIHDTNPYSQGGIKGGFHEGETTGQMAYIRVRDGMKEIGLLDDSNPHFKFLVETYSPTHDYGGFSVFQKVT